MHTFLRQLAVHLYRVCSLPIDSDWLRLSLAFRPLLTTNHYHNKLVPIRLVRYSSVGR